MHIDLGEKAQRHDPYSEPEKQHLRKGNAERLRQDNEEARKELGIRKLQKACQRT